MEGFRRSQAKTHICSLLLNYRDSVWLQLQRSMFVGNNVGPGSRLTLEAGRTGTRISAGKVQVRWQDGTDLAQRILRCRQLQMRCDNAVTIETLINEVRSYDRMSADA